MKRLLSLLVVLVLIVGLIGCGAKADNSKSVNAEKKQEVVSEAITLGESGDSGNWKIKIKQVEEMEKITGHTSDDDVIAADKFIVVLMDMTNISKEPISYSLLDFKLKDTTSGKTYAIQDNGVEASIERVSEEKYYKKNQDYITLNDSVNPDDTKIGCVVFDVSKDLNLDNLVLSNENDGNAGKAVLYKLK